MSIVDKALETQIRNLQTRTGKTLDQLFGLLASSELEQHGEMRDWLKRTLGMGHGDANTLVHLYRESAKGGGSAAGAAEAGSGDPLDAIYTGPKAGLRPIDERLMEAIRRFGAFEIAPKKGYVSLRRKKQFAMIGPATRTHVEVGLNMKGIAATSRLLAMPAGGMCQYKVRVQSASEVDEELVSWIRLAYDSAG